MCVCVCALRLLKAIEIAAYLRSRRTYDEEQQQAKVQLSLNIMGAVVTLQWREATAAADKQLYEDCRDFFSAAAASSPFVDDNCQSAKKHSSS